MSASYFPPCLDPVVIAAQRDLDTLMAHAELRQRARRIIAVGNYGVPETTLSVPGDPAVTGVCFSCGDPIVGDGFPPRDPELGDHGHCQGCSK